MIKEFVNWALKIILKICATAALLWSIPAIAGELQEVEVTGSPKAHVLFRTDSLPNALPQWSVTDNVIDLKFTGVHLPHEKKKQDFQGPHLLVKRISLFESEKGLVRAKIVVSGSPENLKGRVRLSRMGSGIEVEVAPASGGETALKLLEEEQKPVTAEVTQEVPKAPSRSWMEIAVLVLSLGFAGALVFGVTKFLKRTGKWGGSRKYLIEQIAHCSLGHSGKASVSLIKVGGDFLLLGVTAEQVQLIANLTRLSNTFADEKSLEQSSFKEAVEQEVSRLRRDKEANA